MARNNPKSKRLWRMYGRQGMLSQMLTVLQMIKNDRQCFEADTRNKAMDLLIGVQGLRKLIERDIKAKSKLPVEAFND